MRYVFDGFVKQGMEADESIADVLVISASGTAGILKQGIVFVVRHCSANI